LSSQKNNMKSNNKMKPTRDARNIAPVSALYFRHKSGSTHVLSGRRLARLLRELKAGSGQPQMLLLKASGYTETLGGTCVDSLTYELAHAEACGQVEPSIAAELPAGCRPMNPATDARAVPDDAAKLAQIRELVFRLEQHYAATMPIGSLSILRDIEKLTR
jgi:hypothetical protein